MICMTSQVCANDDCGLEASVVTPAQTSVTVTIIAVNSAIS
jgi:hypothetical protein